MRPFIRRARPRNRLVCRESASHDEFFRNTDANENDDQDRSAQASDRSQTGQGRRSRARQRLSPSAKKRRASR